jgi:hypothetical protein
MAALLIVLFFLRTQALASNASSPVINHARGLGPELEALCDGILNSHECARAIERYQLARKPIGATRSGPELIITPQSGAPVILRDSDEKTLVTGHWYQYLKRLSQPGYHLIQVQYYEHQRFLLINAVTGAMLELQGVPVVSPASKRFATGWKTSPGVLGPTTGEINIWAFTPDGPRIEFKYAVDGWAPESFEWQGTREVQATLYNFQSDSQPVLVFRFRDTAWKVEQAAP